MLVHYDTYQISSPIVQILFVQTGGTIDKDYPKLTKGYAFEIGEPAVKSILARINLNEIQPIFESVCRKDSQEITLQDRQNILNKCLHSQANNIIITHGTDSMIETAQYVQNVLFEQNKSENKNLRIILTGSMRPERFINSDAHFNIGMAFAAVQTVDPGVYVVMNGRIIPAQNAVRNLSNGLFLDLTKQLQLSKL